MDSLQDSSSQTQPTSPRFVRVIDRNSSLYAEMYYDKNGFGAAGPTWYTKEGCVQNAIHAKETGLHTAEWWIAVKALNDYENTLRYQLSLKQTKVKRPKLIIGYLLVGVSLLSLIYLFTK